MSTLTKSWRRRDAETTSRGGAATRRVRGGRSRRDGDASPGETHPEPRLCEYPWTSRGAAAAATWIFRRQLREATRRHRQSETGRDPGASAQATTTAIGGCYFAPAAHARRRRRNRTPAQSGGFRARGRDRTRRDVVDYFAPSSCWRGRLEDQTSADRRSGTTKSRSSSPRTA